MSTRHRKIVLPLLVALWLGAVGIGIGAMWSYEATAGHVPVPAASAITEAPLPLVAGRYNLLMVVHPQCVCSRASVAMLEQIVAAHPADLSASVVFAEIAGTPDVTSSALWANASAIAGVRVLRDANGFVSKQLGARTSGTVFLYDPAGKLCFSGGITVSRGHVGDSDGKAAIEAILANEAPRTAHPPVFGCSIQ